MFKSKSSRLAARQRRRQQLEEEQAEAARLAALPKQDYLDNCHRTYSCIHCRAHLANHDELLSKLFQGNYGRAYLFNRVVNIGCKRAITRELLTGLHAVCDIYCKTCDTVLGWKYETAFVPSQKYKEGKFIIELVHMIKENSSDPSSFQLVKRLFHGASRQQVPAYEQVYLSPLSTAGGGGDSSSCSSKSQQQQHKSHKSTDMACRRDRSSSSISIYRNGPSLATGTTRMRAPSVPTCASRQEAQVAVEITISSNGSDQPDGERPTGAENDNVELARAGDIQLRIVNAGDDVQPPFVGVKTSGIITHRKLLLSTSALNLAPTGGGGGPEKGSSENSSQLSSSSASSNSLAAIEHEENQAVVATCSSDK